jgi:hypothetical protein
MPTARSSEANERSECAWRRRGSQRTLWRRWAFSATSLQFSIAQNCVLANAGRGFRADPQPVPIGTEFAQDRACTIHLNGSSTSSRA